MLEFLGILLAILPVWLVMSILYFGMFRSNLDRFVELAKKKELGDMGFKEAAQWNQYFRRRKTTAKIFLVPFAGCFLVENEWRKLLEIHNLTDRREIV